MVVGVAPCLHPIVMLENPTPVYFGHHPNRVRHDTSIYEPMRTVRLRVDFTQGPANGINPQVVGWMTEAAGGYWYFTNPDAFNSGGRTGTGTTVRVTETVNSPDRDVDIALEWVYSSGYGNGRSRGWNIAVTPILDSDGYVTEGMRTLLTVNEASDFCTPTPDAPTDVAPVPPVVTVECDIFTYRVFDSNGFPQTYRYAIAEVSFDPALPTPPAGFEREAQYRARYVQNLAIWHRHQTRWRLSATTGCTGSGHTGHQFTVSLEGATAPSRTSTGWVGCGRLGTYSAAWQHTCADSVPHHGACAAALPDPVPSAGCASSRAGLQFSGGTLGAAGLGPRGRVRGRISPVRHDRSVAAAGGDCFAGRLA